MQGCLFLTVFRLCFPAVLQKHGLLTKFRIYGPLDPQLYLHISNEMFRIKHFPQFYEALVWQDSTLHPGR